MGEKIIFINNLYNEHSKILDNTKDNEQNNKNKLKLVLPRNFYSYEIIDELVDNYNAEYVTIAWLKCYEILEHYKILDNNNKDINYFGICEQPGAFIFSINHYVRGKLKKKLNFTIQSLNTKIDKSGFPPEKSLYDEYRNNYDYGVDFTGDVTSIENIQYYRQKYYDQDYYLITADCGQSCDDFSKQEQNIAKLLIGQILLAISLSSQKTTYVLKLFTLYEEYSLYIY